LIGLSSNIGFDKYNLGKYINAVLNAQGGAIIIGAQKKLSKIIPSGVILSETERERILV
jgi:predicted HTH transcriptional regulator